MNCPFYGCALAWTFAPTFQLIPTRGNQCALVTNAHAPCMLEINGQPVDWRQCPRVAEIRA